MDNPRDHDLFMDEYFLPLPPEMRELDDTSEPGFFMTPSDAIRFGYKLDDPDFEHGVAAFDEAYRSLHELNNEERMDELFGQYIISPDDDLSLSILDDPSSSNPDNDPTPSSTVDTPFELCTPRQSPTPTSKALLLPGEHDEAQAFASTSENDTECHKSPPVHEDSHSDHGQQLAAALIAMALPRSPSPTNLHIDVPPIHVLPDIPSVSGASRVSSPPALRSHTHPVAEQDTPLPSDCHSLPEPIHACLHLYQGELVGPLVHNDLKSAPTDSPFVALMSPDLIASASEPAASTPVHLRAADTAKGAALEAHQGSSSAAPSHDLAPDDAPSNKFVATSVDKPLASMEVAKLRSPGAFHSPSATPYPPVSPGSDFTPPHTPRLGTPSDHLALEKISGNPEDAPADATFGLPSADDQPALSKSKAQREYIATDSMAVTPASPAPLPTPPETPGDTVNNAVDVDMPNEVMIAEAEHGGGRTEVETNVAAETRGDKTLESAYQLSAASHTGAPAGQPPASSLTPAAQLPPPAPDVEQPTDGETQKTAPDDNSGPSPDDHPSPKLAINWPFEEGQSSAQELSTSFKSTPKTHWSPAYGLNKTVQVSQFRGNLAEPEDHLVPTTSRKDLAAHSGFDSTGDAILQSKKSSRSNVPETELSFLLENGANFSAYDPTAKSRLRSTTKSKPAMKPLAKARPSRDRKKASTALPRSKMPKMLQETRKLISAQQSLETTAATESNRENLDPLPSASGDYLPEVNGGEVPHALRSRKRKSTPAPTIRSIRLKVTGSDERSWADDASGLKGGSGVLNSGCETRSLRDPSTDSLAATPSIPPAFPTRPGGTYHENPQARKAQPPLWSDEEMASLAEFFPTSDVCYPPPAARCELYIAEMIKRGYSKRTVAAIQCRVREKLWKRQPLKKKHSRR